MPDSDKPGGNKGPGPTQIPLLEDVFSDARKPERVRRTPARPKPASEPTPAPVITDLFEELFTADVSDVFPVGDELDLEPTDADAAAEAAFRAQAHQLVDRFVQEYSEEILHRLRKELNALLDDLKADDPSPRGDDPAD